LIKPLWLIPLALPFGEIGILETGTQNETSMKKYFTLFCLIFTFLHFAKPAIAQLETPDTIGSGNPVLNVLFAGGTARATIKSPLLPVLPQLVF